MVEPAGFEPAQAYFYAADLQSVELNAIAQRLHQTLWYCVCTYFVIARSIALWAGLDSNERVFWNLIYSQAASTPYLPTHKTIELLRMNFPFKCFVGRARFERARLSEPGLQPGGFNHLPTDPQSNRIIRFRLLQQIFKERPDKVRLWQSTSKCTSLATERLGASSRQSKCALRCSGCEDVSSLVEVTRCDDKFGRTRMEPGYCDSLTVLDIFESERFFGFSAGD